MAATAVSPERRPNRLRWLIRGAAACLLALPLVAMQFTREVQWTGIDFAVMGTLLAIACGAYEFGAWLSGDRTYRAAFGLAVLTGFLLMWVTLAVGIIGAENDEANVLFLGVLATGAIGAVVARFRARGMAIALAATALAQLATIVISIANGWPAANAPSAVFCALWLASAELFRRAAR